MDAIRRGAMVKMGQRVIGGIGAASMLGGGQETIGATLGYAEQSANAYPSDAQGYATQEPISPRYRAEKKMAEARYRAAQPLRDKLEELRGGTPKQRYRLLENNIGLHQRTTDLPALKSTAPWWRDCVAMERAQKRMSAIDQLEGEWQKLVSDPLEQTAEPFRNAVAALFAELSKP